MFLWFSFSRTTNYLIQLTSALIGIALSLYLLLQHTELKSGIQASASFCSISSFADCDVVNASAFSEILGIPLASMGAFFYFSMLMVILLFPVGQKGFDWGQAWVGRLGLLGLMVDCYLFGVQLGVLRNLCVMCLLTYVATLVIFLTAFANSERKKEGIVFYLKSILGPEFAPAPVLTLAHLLLVFFSIASFTALLWLIPPSIRVRSQAYERVNQAMEVYFEQWKEQTGRKFPVKKGDGVLGNPAAKVQIVEFSDFECPHCQRAAFTLHTAMKMLKDKVHFVFKHYPLDSSCNPGVKVQMHPNACPLARLAYCMEVAGKFWQFHDAVFFSWSKESHDSSHAVLDSVTSGTLAQVLDSQRYEECMKNPASLANIHEDIQLGVARGVDGTPAVFINGKRVTIPLSLENITKLVEIESRL